MPSCKRRCAGEGEGEHKPLGTWRWFTKTAQARASLLTSSIARGSSVFASSDTPAAERHGSPIAKRRRTSLMEATPALSPLGCGFTPGRSNEADVHLPVPFGDEGAAEAAPSTAQSHSDPVQGETGAPDTAALQVHTREECLRAQLDAIYSRRNPRKRKNISALMEKYKGREAILYRKVCQQYCLCPTKFYADAKAWQGLDSDLQDDTAKSDTHESRWRGLVRLLPGVARVFGGSDTSSQAPTDSGARRTTLLLGASRKNLDSLLTGHGGLGNLLGAGASSSSSDSAGPAAVESPPSTINMSGSAATAGVNSTGQRAQQPFSFSFGKRHDPQAVFGKSSSDTAEEPEACKWQPIWPLELQSNGSDVHQEEEKSQCVTFRRRRADPEVLARRRIVKVKRSSSAQPSLNETQAAATPHFGKDALEKAGGLTDTHLKRKASCELLRNIPAGKLPRHEYGACVASPARANWSGHNRF